MPPWDAPILTGDHPLSGKEDINAPVGNCQMVIIRCRIRAELMERLMGRKIGEIGRQEQTVGAGFVGQATLQPNNWELRCEAAASHGSKNGTKRMALWSRAVVAKLLTCVRRRHTC
jgi:hypothetical protein